MQTAPPTRELIAEFEAAAMPHRNVLFQSARSLLYSRAEAEDAMQETYFQAWKSFSRFTPGTNCRAWLFTILFNVVRHHRRKWLFRVRLVDDACEFERKLIHHDPVATELGDEEILDALQAIRPEYAEVVLLCDVQDFTYKEAHEALRIPLGTVMSRLSRGRAALRAKLCRSSIAASMGLSDAIKQEACEAGAPA